jgi:hypothetical protein
MIASAKKFTHHREVPWKIEWGEAGMKNIPADE